MSYTPFFRHNPSLAGMGYADATISGTGSFLAGHSFAWLQGRVVPGSPMYLHVVVDVRTNGNGAAPRDAGTCTDEVVFHPPCVGFVRRAYHRRSAVGL